MPVDYRIDEAEGVAYMRAWGALTLADVVAARDRMIADPDFSPGMKQLVDAREVQEVKITAAEARRSASSAAFGSGARRAFVATSDELFGLFRMYGGHTERLGAELHVFREMEEACEWLGLSSGP